jgi:hypothetical protein
MTLLACVDVQCLGSAEGYTLSLVWTYRPVKTIFTGRLVMLTLASFSLTLWRRLCKVYGFAHLDGRGWLVNIITRNLPSSAYKPPTLTALQTSSRLFSLRTVSLFTEDEMAGIGKPTLIKEFMACFVLLHSFTRRSFCFPSYFMWGTWLYFAHTGFEPEVFCYGRRVYLLYYEQYVKNRQP